HVHDKASGGIGHERVSRREPSPALAAQMRQGEWKVDGPSIRVYAAGGFTEDDVLARRRAQRRRHQARVVYAFQHRRRKHARRELKAELAAPMDLTLERVPHRIGIGREPGARLVAEDELLRGESGPARIAASLAEPTSTPALGDGGVRGSSETSSSRTSMRAPAKCRSR